MSTNFAMFINKAKKEDKNFSTKSRFSLLRKFRKTYQNLENIEEKQSVLLEIEKLENKMFLKVSASDRYIRGRIAVSKPKNMVGGI